MKKSPLTMILSRQPLAGDAYFKAAGFVSKEGDHIKGYSCPFRGYRFVEMDFDNFYCPVGAILCDVR